MRGLPFTRRSLSLRPASQLYHSLRPPQVRAPLAHAQAACDEVISAAATQLRTEAPREDLAQLSVLLGQVRTRQHAMDGAQAMLHEAGLAIKAVDEAREDELAIADHVDELTLRISRAERHDGDPNEASTHLPCRAHNSRAEHTSPVPSTHLPCRAHISRAQHTSPVPSTHLLCPAHISWGLPCRGLPCSRRPASPMPTLPFPAIRRGGHPPSRPSPSQVSALKAERTEAMEEIARIHRRAAEARRVLSDPLLREWYPEVSRPSPCLVRSHSSLPSPTTSPG